MDAKRSLQSYEQRLNAVLDHIETRFDQPLPLENLADIACFSPFHFHRIFKEYTGETPGIFVRRLRLQKALQIMEYGGQRSLTEVAMQCGFAQSSDFTRAFRDVYGYPPSKHTKGRAAENSKIRQDLFRDAGYRFPEASESQSGDNFHVRIETMPEHRIGYVRVIGAYQPTKLIGGLNRLLDWGRSRGIYPGATLASISPDNPEIVPSSRYRIDLCMVVPPGFREDSALSFATIPTRKYAMVHCHGDIMKVQRGWTHLFGSWLPSSGYEPDDAPMMEWFRDSDDSTGWSTLDLDCCLPIRSIR